MKLKNQDQHNALSITQHYTKMAALHGQPPGFQGHTMSEERFEKIETTISFQEDLIEELNKTIYQQQKKLEQLEAKCEALASYTSSLAEAVNENNPVMSERPPHY